MKAGLHGFGSEIGLARWRFGVAEKWESGKVEKWKRRRIDDLLNWKDYRAQGY
jgi:hypothetical protein